MDYVTPILTIENQYGRAFRNLFSIQIYRITTSGQKVLDPLAVDCEFFAKRIMFDSLILESEQIEATKVHAFSRMSLPRTCTISLNEVYDYQILSYLLHWTDDIFDRSQQAFTVGVDRDRRRRVVITVDKQSRESNSPLVITVEGVLANVPLPNYDWESGDPISYDSVVLNIDKMEFNFGGVKLWPI